MTDEQKTKAQLIEELNQLRRLVDPGITVKAPPEGDEKKGPLVAGQLQAVGTHQTTLVEVQSKLRDAVGKMASSDDFKQVLLVLKAGLAQLGIEFQDCGVNLIDRKAETVAVSVNRLTRTGVWPQTMSARAQEVISQFWRGGLPVYRRDLEAEDVYHERHRILADFGSPVRSVIDVPFAFGTMAVNSPRPDAFSPENISDMQHLAGVLEEGLRRKGDLQDLEERNRELESEIAVRQLRETELETMKGQLQATMAAIPDLLFELGLEGCFHGYHSHRDNLLAAPPEVFLGKKVVDILPPEVAGMVMSTLREAHEKGWAQGKDYALQLPQGQQWFEFSIAAKPVDPGQEHRFVVVVRDITERKQTETRLRDEQKRLRTILDTVGDPIFVKDMDHRIILANQAFYELFSLDEDAVIGYTLAEKVPENERAQFLEVDRRVLDIGLPDLREESLTVKGLTRTIVTRKTRFVEESGTRFLVGSIQDITESKRLEQEQIHLQRLRAVGELSAGICHNLNNLLTGVLGPADLLQMTSDDPKIQRLSGMIVEAGTRAAELVHRLHLSVRTRNGETLVPIALNRMIDEAIQMARPRWQDEPESKGLEIEVRTVLAEVPPVKGTESELHDLLINLLFNAVDALPQGGIIMISTSLEGAFVRLDFSDTGIGMDEATRSRIFEPFFTTKMDVGTGLGLSTLHNSMTNWGGTVAVESAPGKGTTFTLQLPVWQEEAITAPSPSVAVESRPGRVLIVEDDPTIGRVLGEVLSIWHQVEVFTDGQKALAAFSAGKYDVAILDLGMPGLPGDQVAQRIAAIDPAVGRILFSGWVVEADDPRSKLFDFALQKPLRDLRVFTEVVAQAIVLRDQRAGTTG